jgi:hypothetical protein
MNSFLLFKDFFSQGCREIFQEKRTYFRIIFLLIVLANLEPVLNLFGLESEGWINIILSIFVTLGTFIVLSQVVLKEKIKKIPEASHNHELGYFVSTFFLFNLYYSFLFFIGLIFLVIPGLWVLIYFFLVPFIAVLDDSLDSGYFKKSIELVKKNVGLVSIVSIFILVLEFSSLLLSPIQNSSVKLISSLFFSIPDSFLTVVLTIVSVRVYYFLSESSQ